MFNRINGRYSDIAGLIVLYNPDQNVIGNIQSYINQLSMFYVVDNSEVYNNKIIETIKSFSISKYIFNGENLGIAKALNIGAEEAITALSFYLHLIRIVKQLPA